MVVQVSTTNTLELMNCGGRLVAESDIDYAEETSQFPEIGTFSAIPLPDLCGLWQLSWQVRPRHSTRSPPTFSGRGTKREKDSHYSVLFYQCRRERH